MDKKKAVVLPAPTVWFHRTPVTLSLLFITHLVDCVEYLYQCTLRLWFSKPHENCATDGYGAIHRQYPPGSLSMTLLDLGVNLFDCIVASVILVSGLHHYEKFGKSVFSPTSLTEGLRPRPTWHASSAQPKKSFRSQAGPESSATVLLFLKLCLFSCFCSASVPKTNASLHACIFPLSCAD